MKYIVTATACTFLVMAQAPAASLNKGIHVTTASDPTDDHRTLNGGIEIDAGVKLDSGTTVSSINGAIRVGSGAVVGELETVNGKIELQDDVQAARVSTVNGAIRLGENVSIAGDVVSVNGALTVPRSSSVRGDLENVNGEITVDGGRVDGNITTYNGSMSITDGATVGGDIRVRKPNHVGWGDRDRKNPKVVIGPDTRVTGNLVFERDVDLYVHDSAQVGGVIGATANSFSGRTPDQ